MRKVLFIELPGEPDSSKPLGIAEGLFYLINYFTEKEGFLDYLLVYLNNKDRKQCY